jgi:hypothetical protein
MKSYTVWDIMPCSPLKVNRSFGGKCHLDLHGGGISKQETRVKKAAILHAGLLLASFFEPEEGGDIFPRNVG